LDLIKKLTSLFNEDILGRSHRPIPKWLAEKLYYIRLSLDFTQKQMLERLQIGLAEDVDPITGLYPSHISEYEKGIREPPLRVLLEYSRIAQVPMEVIVDQRMSLPSEFSLFFQASMLKERKAEAALRRSKTNKNKPKPRKIARPKSPNRKPK
jgi:transcriptional regulator with XRE-family HTH domain